VSTLRSEHDEAAEHNEHAEPAELNEAAEHSEHAEHAEPAEHAEHDVAILADDEHAEPAEHNELAEEHNELAEEHNELPELAELTEHEEDAERRGLRRKRAMARMQIQRVQQTGHLRRLQCV